MRTRNFNFRLVDYEYIVPAVLKKYPTKYLSDTEVICKALSYKNLKFNATDSKLNVEIRWSCDAILEVTS
jgi:hypothetical protein